MAGYPKTFCMASLPLGLHPQEGLHSATKTCSSGTSRRVALRQEVLKRCQRTVAVGDTLPSQLSRQQSRKERSSGKKRELAGAREQRQIQLPWMTTPSHAATVTRSAVRGSASTATAGAAALPGTDIYGRKLHCLPRQTDANIFAPNGDYCLYAQSLRSGSFIFKMAAMLQIPRVFPCVSCLGSAKAVQCPRPGPKIGDKSQQIDTSKSRAIPPYVPGVNSWDGC